MRAGPTIPLVRSFLNPRCLVLRADEDLVAAMERLRRHGYSGAPVVDGAGSLVGMFSELDAVKAMAHALFEQGPATTVGAAATAQVQTLTADQDLFAAVAVFEQGRVRRVPVVEGGVLIGLVTLRDIEDALWRLADGLRRAPDFVPGAAFIPADRR